MKNLGMEAGTGVFQCVLATPSLQHGLCFDMSHIVRYCSD